MNSQMSRHRSRRAAQRGFTLVELMISILIGVFLAGGLMTLVGAMKRTSTTQTGLSNLQENERLAMSLLADVVQSAGYWPNPTGTTSALAFSVTSPFTAAGQVLSGTHSAAAPGDTLSVRYATGGATDNVINCTGSGSAVASTYINTFSLIHDPSDTDLTHMLLQCTLTLNGAAQPPVFLVKGVMNLQILYGVKTNAAVTGNSIDTYLTANNVTDWSQVISVQITLSFINPLAGQPGQPALGTPIQFTRIVDIMNKAGVST